MAELKINNKNEINDILAAENAEYSDTLSKKLKIIWRRLKKNKMAVLSIIVLIILYSSAIFAPLIAPYNPEGTADDILQVDRAPSFRSYEDYTMEGELVKFRPNLFGRDELGRDVFSCP